MKKKKIVEDESVLKARPQIEGLDPLAGADRLYNNANSEDASHYEVDNSERKADEAGLGKPKPVADQPLDHAGATWSLPPSKVKNASKLEQDKVAKGRKE